MREESQNPNTLKLWKQFQCFSPTLRYIPEIVRIHLKGQSKVSVSQATMPLTSGYLKLKPGSKNVQLISSLMQSIRRMFEGEWSRCDLKRLNQRLLTYESSGMINKDPHFN
ncbi:hypothetical protein AMECASPLE_001740 [Ameca splendens]|uniref:Uncharacterized protein n=1 Tax=Ameca splendens TaxID=208324 RepID=A0ABV0ZKF9_9TELE